MSSQETRQWAMALHLSLLAGYIVPLAGFVAPIVIWQVKKRDMPELDLHGRIVANWMVSLLIYVVLSLLLIFVLIGIPLLWALGIISVVFPIVGAIKASQGELWRYPGSVTFFG